MRFRMEKMVAIQKGQTKRLEGYENAPESVKESVGYYDKVRPYYMSFYERAYNLTDEQVKDLGVFIIEVEDNDYLQELADLSVLISTSTVIYTVVVNFNDNDSYHYKYDEKSHKDVFFKQQSLIRMVLESGGFRLRDTRDIFDRSIERFSGSKGKQFIFAKPPIQLDASEKKEELK